MCQHPKVFSSLIAVTICHHFRTESTSQAIYERKVDCIPSLRGQTFHDRFVLKRCFWSLPFVPLLLLKSACTLRTSEPGNQSLFNHFSIILDDFLSSNIRKHLTSSSDVKNQFFKSNKAIKVETTLRHYFRLRRRQTGDKPFPNWSYKGRKWIRVSVINKLVSIPTRKLIRPTISETFFE